MPNAESDRLLRFGVFELDPRTGELKSKGSRVKLQDQPLQILLAVLERPGEIVTREELRAKLWAANTFVDFDHGLNAAVKRLRDALGDTAENPKYIETLPRHGYRFIAAAVPGAPPPERRHTPLKQWGWLLGVAAVLLIAGALFAVDVGGVRSKLLSRAAARPQIHSLAVLPLANLSGDPLQEYFADGMTEALISEVSRISSLRVISQTSVMQYKGEKKKPVPQIGRELHVDAVLEGSVLRSGDRVRIATHLINASTDQSLMTETYESDLGDILKLQREVAESIAEKVRAKLTPEQQARLHETPKVDPEAYESYLQATYLDWTLPQENEKARSYLDMAIRKDPGFADAYGLLAWNYIDVGQFRWQPPREAYPPARQTAGKALELDPNNCPAHAALGYLADRNDWDWTTEEREWLRVLELCPNDVRSHVSYALYLSWKGRATDALAEAAKCRELDPVHSEPLHVESFIYYHLKNYKDLIEVGRSYTALWPNRWLSHYWLGVGYEGSGRTLEAIPEYQKAVELSQGDQDPTAALAYAYAATGRKAEARKILHEWLRQSENKYVSPYMIATVYASLEDKDKAFEYLEKAYQEKSSDLPYFLRADLRLDTLRSDPRFQDLLRRMNFPQ